MISNGTIALGVNARGHIGALLNPDNSWWGDGNVGINYMPADTDLLAAHGYPGDCMRLSQPNWTPQDSNWPAWGELMCYNEFVDGYSDVNLRSFSHTATEATSVIQSGSAVITQRFHPSASPNAYQLDITIQIKGCSNGQTCDPYLRYRRIMPVNIPVTTGEDGYLTPVPDYVTWAHDPTQTDVLGYTNLADEVSTQSGWIEDLPAAASVIDGDDPYNASQGFAIDLAIQADTTGNPGISPQATLYLGAAPTNQAASVMSSIGARTYGLVTPPEEYNTNGITVFLAH